MIINDHDYLDVAMKAYDNPSCITMEEFNKDLNQYIHIKKGARRYLTNEKTLRKFVNQVVIYYNCFGKAGTDLLLYKTHEEDVLAVLIPVILYLGRSTTTLESINVSLNIDIIKQLSEL